MSAEPTIPTNTFIGHMNVPSDDELASCLGPSQPLWARLIAELGESLEAHDSEWRSYSPKAGWSLRVKKGKRTIVWLSPSRNCFIATIILGEKAVRAAQDMELPKHLLTLINEAKKYPEGRAVPLVIKRDRDLAAVKVLAAIKVAH